MAEMEHNLVKKEDGKAIEDIRSDYDMLMQALSEAEVPTNGELKKLLAAQGLIMHGAAQRLLTEGFNLPKRGDRKIQMALKAFAESRESYIKAAGIEE